MENKNSPAFPLPATESNGSFYTVADANNGGSLVGLTKREYFAIQVMQGLLANDWQGYSDRQEECGLMAETAINYADALLKELDK